MVLRWTWEWKMETEFTPKCVEPNASRWGKKSSRKPRQRRSGRSSPAEHNAQLTSFLDRTADETLKSLPMDQRYYSSASNSLLARTADRTPKTLTLQGDPSRSTFTPSSKRSPYIVYRGSRDVTWNLLVHSSVSPLLIEISRRFQHL
ncbi:hypothetical protein AVEN_246751-1 [Araneus ventricosus]|uniref:Uncharacterized protein n=1 Tax=Araneus ventricosus TaxID=182803 RepID=A0A4Y2RXJ5_ARAVE|nr:hypothetical protein AVEN_122464-1 [Araneus ventricosus]GBN80597.1 hypothetical protein AVEN_246751-1 [Araneus ventricosus]